MPSRGFVLVKSKEGSLWWNLSNVPQGPTVCARGPKLLWNGHEVLSPHPSLQGHRDLQWIWHKKLIFIQEAELGHWLGQQPRPGAAGYNSRAGGGCPKNPWESPGGDPWSQGCSRRGGQGSEERFQEHEPSCRNSHGIICRNRKLSVRIN